MDKKTEMLTCFNNYASQLEGWLKAELLYFLDVQKKAGRIVNVAREQTFSIDNRNKIDFCISIRESNEIIEKYWFEIKHWHIGMQSGERYGPIFYFSDGGSNGIVHDIEKLVKASPSNRFMMILATTNPGEENWKRGVAKFNSKFSNYRIASLTDPRYFPPEYFLGLLDVGLA